MADINKLLNLPSPLLKSPLSFPLNLSSLHNFSPLRRRLSLSSLNPKFSSPSNFPNLLLISTSVNSDGSLVFKFGDASEIPPAVENADDYDTTSDNAEIEAELETESDGNVAVNDQASIISKVENDVEDVIESKDCPMEVLEFKEITVETSADSVNDDQNRHDLVAASVVDDVDGEDSKLDVITVSGFDVENLDSGVALEDEDIDDVIKPNVDEVVELMMMPPVLLEAEAVVEEEVNGDGLPSIARLEDSHSGDSADAAFPSLEVSVVTSETIVDREETSSHNGDISTLPLSMSSAAASLSHPLEANYAVPSAILQSCSNSESRDVSESAGPAPKSSGTASEEANLDSVQISTVELSVPSATASLSQAIEVDDAATPPIQQSDDDLHSDIYVAADPGPRISSTAEINLREEISAPSLCLVSAAASLAHSTEALTGGDDAYFVCDDWFGVADGVGQWSFGGIDKGLYAQEFIQNCERLARKSLNTGLNSLKELLQQSALMTESSGAARVLIAHIADQVLHVANIGDSGFVIVRNGTVFKKSSPMFHEFNFPYAISSGDNPVEAVEVYHVELEDGDMIVTATDGLFDNLYEHEIASLVSKAVEDGKNVKDIAELLASRSQEVGKSPYARTPFADAAQAAGHTEFSGGKYDHVTVIVSAVQKE